MLGRRMFKYFLIILSITLLLGACVSVKQPDLKIQEENIVRLVKEGAKLYDNGRYEEALSKLSQAEKQARLPEDKIEIADLLSKAAFALLEKKLFKMALSYYERSLDINRTLDHKPGLINNYSYIGKTYTDIGKYEEGIRSLEEALKIQKELGDKAGIAHNLNNVANLFSYLGNYQDSIKLLNQALGISEEIKDSTQTAKTLINLGTIHLRLRNYQQSIEYLNRAFEIADDANEENLKAYALNIMGVVYREQDNYEKALGYYQRALRINKKLGSKTEIATNLGTIGELYKELGHYDQALQYLEQSLNMAKELKNQLIAAIIMSYIGEVRFKQGNYEKALSLYDQSLKMFEELGAKDRIARSFNHIGYVEGETEDYDVAIKNFDKAIGIYKDLGDREWIRIALFGKGVYLEEKGDLVSAEKNYKEAVDVFESIREDVVGGEEGQQIFSNVNVKIYEKLVSLLIRQGKTEEALEYIQRSRSKSLRDNLLKSGISSFEDKIRGQLVKYDELSRREASINYELVREKSRLSPNQEKIENLSRTLAKTREEFNQVAFRLKEEYPRIYSLLRVSPQNLSDLRERVKLPSNLSILQYFIAENETYIFTVSNSGLTVKSSSIKKEDLNRMVSDFRRLTFESSSFGADKLKLSIDTIAKNKKLLDELSIILYNYLIKPVKGDIEDAEVVGIIPFGILNYLPFQALAEKGAGDGLEFFLEQKNLAYLINLDQLDYASANGKAKSFESIVAFGNPDLGEPELVLPHSKKEVLAIKDIFPNALVFLEDKATKENFKNNWGKYRIVHLSAHGILNEEGQFILLAPVGSGTLSITDIMELPPAEKINFVTLSACSTAIDPFQKNPTGTQLATLAFAFAWVEVPSTIATLWDISDQGTADLMKAFYKNLKDGKTLYTAFREAQVYLIKRNDKYSHPYYWAPFILFGNWN
ncbi:MAG TPA: CHAT domain-containing tetratricopeptide repeat protein [Thermodesulfobacteriota bacterium]|nr:CHAT domain-containing tetratricopeptide repeat protein [Thermodesulfobacteriota bacterium]